MGDWAALHVWPKVEFYVQCVDIEISSTSTISPASLDGFSITNPPIYPDNGNDGVGYRNGFARSEQEMTQGPSSCPSAFCKSAGSPVPTTKPTRTTPTPRPTKAPTTSPISSTSA